MSWWTCWSFADKIVVGDHTVMNERRQYWAEVIFVTLCFGRLKSYVVRAVFGSMRLIGESAMEELDCPPL